MKSDHQYFKGSFVLHSFIPLHSPVAQAIPSSGVGTHVSWGLSPNAYISGCLETELASASIHQLILHHLFLFMGSSDLQFIPDGFPNTLYSLSVFGFHWINEIARVLNPPLPISVLYQIPSDEKNTFTSMRTDWVAMLSTILISVYGEKKKAKSSHSRT